MKRRIDRFLGAAIDDGPRTARAETILLLVALALTVAVVIVQVGIAHGVIPQGWTP